MEPIIARNSKFIERWSGAERMNVQLGITVLSLTALCLCLSAGLIYMTIRPKPIYYVPGVVDGGMAMPQSMPQANVSSFVSSWVLNWTNFTPATVTDVYARSQRFMSPHLLAQTQARLAKDIDEVKHNNISSLFSIIEEPLVSIEKQGFRITLRGEKGVFMGKEEVKVQLLIYRVRVRRVNPTENNPYGLMIEEIDQEEVS